MIYIGIDPGKSGGLARITLDGRVDYTNMPETVRFVQSWVGAQRPAHVALEVQDPRPTFWFDRATLKWKQSILKSTCLLYGQYRELYAYLTTLDGVTVHEVRPKEWQKGLSIRAREKGESESQWKQRLRAEAQRRAGGQFIPLKVADAVLMAYYLRSKLEASRETPPKNGSRKRG